MCQCNVLEHQLGRRLEALKDSSGYLPGKLSWQPVAKQTLSMTSTRRLSGVLMISHALWSKYSRRQRKLIAHFASDEYNLELFVQRHILVLSKNNTLNGWTVGPRVDTNFFMVYVLSHPRPRVYMVRWSLKYRKVRVNTESLRSAV